MNKIKKYKILRINKENKIIDLLDLESGKEFWSYYNNLKDPKEGEIINFVEFVLNPSENLPLPKIDILVPGVKERFEDWIKNRGGVQIWQNVDLSNPDAGDIYTPYLNEDKTPTPVPKWSHTRKGDLIQDINCFRFATELKEVDRFRIVTRISSNGLSIKLVDASSEKVRTRCEDAHKKYGVVPTYHFEEKECIISVPVFQEEKS